MEYPVNLLVIIIFILLILLLILLLRPRRRKQNNDENIVRKIPVVPWKKQRLPRYNPNEELIFFLDTSKTSKEQFIAELLKRFSFSSGGPKFHYPCPCTDTVFTIEGITPLISGSPDPTQPPTGDGKTPPLTASGSFGGALYCPNYYFDLPYRNNTEISGSQYYRYLSGTTKNEEILVAVLDTGLDPEIAALYQPKVETSCVDIGSKGYNFISNGSDTSDDFGADIDPCNPVPPGHGTPVTGLILQTAAARVNIKILPVKCLDKNGHATLIQVMCAMAYAKKAGAKIINLSLGFYSPLSDFVELFRTFLLEQITKDNTIVVAAAGNISPEEDKQAMAAPENILEENLRNLDEHLFFPAAFSQDNKNVIAVTTISHQTGKDPENFTVCPRQNYSASKVQIGVAADLECYRFLGAFVSDLEPGKRTTWIGSSFAAPVVTGLLAATYHQYMAEHGAYDRDKYFTWLKKNEGSVFKDKSSMSLLPNDQLPDWLLLRGAAETQTIAMKQAVISSTKP